MLSWKSHYCFFKCRFLALWVQQAKCHLAPLHVREGRHLYDWYLLNTGTHSKTVRMDEQHYRYEEIYSSLILGLMVLFKHTRYTSLITHYLLMCALFAVAVPLCFFSPTLLTSFPPVPLSSMSLPGEIGIVWDDWRMSLCAKMLSVSPDASVLRGLRPVPKHRPYPDCLFAINMKRAPAKRIQREPRLRWGIARKKTEASHDCCTFGWGELWPDTWTNFYTTWASKSTLIVAGLIGWDLKDRAAFSFQISHWLGLRLMTEVEQGLVNEEIPIWNRCYLP